ncbi:hypothetical protein D3C73_1046280 [compost metagenome]
MNTPNHPAHHLGRLDFGNGLKILKKCSLAAEAFTCPLRREHIRRLNILLIKCYFSNAGASLQSRALISGMPDAPEYLLLCLQAV